MTNELTAAAKQIGDELITLSEKYDADMETWGEVAQRSDTFDKECAGFIAKETATGLNFVLDIQIEADEAALRLWAIGSKADEDGNERFNNIQLDFATDITMAREIVAKAENITRSDIRMALQQPGTQLSRLIVSNQSGFSAATQQPLGERYDITIEAGQYDEKAVAVVLKTVLATLKEA